MHTDTDHALMDQALEQARRAQCLSAPNPAVGCVISRADGTVIGLGHTQRVGQAHAEVMALRDAQSRGQDTGGATAYVTLEPCSHTGRTPPCVDALIAARLARVVVAVDDPNPLVAGRGLTRLRAAGLRVDLGLRAREAREINPGFFSRFERGRPWVRMKAAASLDGYTALPDGRGQWITEAAARRDGHAWRARAGAILSGIGTVLADDARLDVRLDEAQAARAWDGGEPRQPLRVLVDSRLRVPLDARILAPPGQPWVATTQGPQGAASAKLDALLAQGVRVLTLPDANGRVDLAALLQTLAREHINEVHVEAGAHLNGALLQAGCVDELLLYVAPKMLGAGRGLWTLPALGGLDAAVSWRLGEATLIGNDARLRVYHPDSAAFLEAVPASSTPI